MKKNLENSMNVEVQPKRLKVTTTGKPSSFLAVGIAVAVVVLALSILVR